MRRFGSLFNIYPSSLLERGGKLSHSKLKSITRKNQFLFFQALKLVYEQNKFLMPNRTQLETNKIRNIPLD